MGVKITDNLPQHAETVRHRAETLVTQALVRGTSELPAITPVDTGKMLNSLFRSVQSTDQRISGFAGFTAQYALWVHNATGKLKGKPRPGNRGFYWGPHDGQPKFLSVAFARAMPDIESILKGGLLQAGLR